MLPPAPLNTQYDSFCLSRCVVDFNSLSRFFQSRKTRRKRIREQHGRMSNTEQSKSFEDKKKRSRSFKQEDRMSKAQVRDSEEENSQERSDRKRKGKQTERCESKHGKEKKSANQSLDAILTCFLASISRKGCVSRLGFFFFFFHQVAETRLGSKFDKVSSRFLCFCLITAALFLFVESERVSFCSNFVQSFVT